MTKCDGIFIKATILLILCAINGVKSRDSDESLDEEMQEKWEKCCRKYMCIWKSCYIVSWSYSNWATVRQRCQMLYPDWTKNVDLFRIQDEKDIKTFWEMLQRKEKPKSVWTSGTRCAKNVDDDVIGITAWVSTRTRFPPWLDEKVKDINFKKRGCDFLVLTPSQNITDVKYDFQDQNAHHPAICEFRLPDYEVTTESESTTVTKFQSTVETEESPTTPHPSTKSTTSTSTSSVPSQKTPEHSSYDTTSEITETTKITTTTVALRYCKSQTKNSIIWPDTLAGITARVACPKGMIGFAEWHCNEETLKFQPKNPSTEGCKHQWIDRLEDYIREKHDAVEISSALAVETRHNNMSHGDIIALVNLTSNLLSLYTEQKGEEEFEVSESEEMPVYYNFTKTMISSISNILRTEIKDAWKGLNDTRQTKEASTILKLVTTIGSRLSCIKTSADKLQFTVSEENIDLQTFILNNTNGEDVIMFPQETGRVKADSSIAIPADLKLAKWFSSCRTYSSAVGVVYKHVGDFLKTSAINSTTEVATKVLGFSLSNETRSIPLAGGKANITLQHMQRKDIQYLTVRNPRCVFWNFSKSKFGAWDESGCELIAFNETHTLCQCDHLTNFAVLMDIHDIIDDDIVLTMMTYICCGFSSFALVLTLACFIMIRALHGRRSIITGNLCFTLLITNILVIFGLDKTENKTTCAVIAGILHYWILAAFCWMLVEGYHLYQMVILVFQRGSSLSVKYYYIFAYGLPLIIVGISAAIRSDGYGGEKFCWLSPSNGLIWSFVGPACIIILVNIVIFILTLRSASSVKIKREQSTMKKMKSWIRGSISVMCLLGLTWCIGLFYIDRKMRFFSYIFTIANGLQGAFIFLFHILLNDKVSSYVSCSSKDKGRRGMRKFLNSSSNQTNSKISTRTSTNSTGCTVSTKVLDTKKKSMPSSPTKNSKHNEPHIVPEPMDHIYENYRPNSISRPGSNSVTKASAF